MAALGRKPPVGCGLGQPETGIRVTVRKIFPVGIPAQLLIVMCSGASLAACGDSLRWSEEVQLPDGRVVTAMRYQEFNGPSEPFKDPTASDYRVEFRNPDTGEKVVWKHSRELATVALSINNKVPELLTTPAFGTLQYRCPDPPYLAFRYIDGKWTQIGLTEVAGRTVAPNMTSLNVRYLQPYVESRGNHLSAQEVTTHLPKRFRGKVIDLNGLDKQTFGDPSDCARPDNWWLADAPDGFQPPTSPFPAALGPPMDGSETGKIQS